MRKPCATPTSAAALVRRLQRDWPELAIDADNLDQLRERWPDLVASLRSVIATIINAHLKRGK